MLPGCVYIFSCDQQASTYPLGQIWEQVSFTGRIYFLHAQGFYRPNSNILLKNILWHVDFKNVTSGCFSPKLFLSKYGYSFQKNLLVDLGISFPILASGNITLKGGNEVIACVRPTPVKKFTTFRSLPPITSKLLSNLTNRKN